MGDPVLSPKWRWSGGKQRVGAAARPAWLDVYTISLRMPERANIACERF
jgi:hypothetical protein